MSANYTLTLSEIINNQRIKIFPDKYSFYVDDENLKDKFEQQFINNFLYDEIGFETLGMFKQRLKVKLNNLMPYYKEVYKTILESKNFDFLNNKDYRETYTREIEGTSNNSSNTTTINSSNSVVNTSDNFIDKGYNTPSSEVTNYKNYLTGISENNSSSESSTTDTGSLTTGANSDNTNRNIEKYSLEGKGNIGVTSTAQLLKEYQESIRDLNMEIINECEDLFMLVY